MEVSQSVKKRTKRFYSHASFKFPYTNALVHLARTHASPYEVIAELVDNGRDAGARSIIIEISRDTIRVTDDGQGMVPYITDKDHSKFETFLASFDGEREPAEIDEIRKVVEKISLQSLEWMAVNAAFSGKQEIDTNNRGIWGVGAQTARSLGDTIVFLTRPSGQLALTYWGPGEIAKKPPVLAYEAPTKVQLTKYDVEPRIGISSTPLTDYLGHDLVQGTQVTISDLRNGIIETLKPSMLKDQLNVRFGNDVARGLKISIIDNLTKEARNKGGVELRVVANSYRGSLIYSDDLVLRDGAIRCSARIYYSPITGKTGVTLRRKDSDVNELYKLPNLNESIFRPGNLTGYIEYPDIQEAEMDSKKTTPLTGTLFRDWTKAVKDMLPIIRERIEALENRSKEAGLNEVHRQVTDAMLQALGQIEDFNPLSIQGATRQREKPEPTERKQNPDYVERRLLARVEDEYRQPLADVELTCVSSSGVIRKFTGASGQVSFGSDLEGQFEVAVVIPAGMTALDTSTVQVVNLTSSMRGQRLIFRLQTGKPGPVALNLKGLGIVLTKDLGVIYSAKNLPYSSVIHIDPDMGEYGEAYKKNDQGRIAELTALYVACAVVEIAYNHAQPIPQQPDFQLMKAADLASITLRIMRERFGLNKK